MVKLKIGVLISLSVSFFFSCIRPKEADLIVHNGTIYTCDVEFSSTQAMAIKNGKILELGPEHQILNKYDAKEKLDLKKKTVIPTFFDGHSYLLAKALKSNAIDFNELDKIELVHSTINYVYNIPEEAIESINFPQSKFVARSVSGNTIKVDGQTYQLVYDWPQSMPVLIYSTDSITTVLDYIEKQQVLNFKSKNIESELFKNGYAGLSSFGVAAGTAQKILEENNSSFYHHLILGGNSKNFAWLTKNGRNDSGDIHLKGISYFIDGGFGSEQALLKSSYYSSNNCGILFADSFALYELPKLCASLNFQLIFHAYGDSAFAIATSEMGKALQSVNDRRWRIEHNQLVDNLDLENLKSFSILPSVQPTQANTDKEKVTSLIGENRDCNTYNFEDLFRQNQFIASGTLYPIDGINPFEQFKALIKSENCYFPLDRKSALKALTIWPAMLAFFDEHTGSLEIGKNADFVVLKNDIMKTPFERLSKTTIQTTYIKGQLTYQVH